MRVDIFERESEILTWIANEEPKSFICRELGCRPITLNSWLKKMGIIYHGNRGLRGKKNDPKRKSALEYINSHINIISSSKLKRKLIEDGIKEYKCENCELTRWNDNMIPLELHHCDGNIYNNELDNLQILCPNCHSLTDTNSGKNIGNYR